jgi:glycine/D-amino acid oxidase-like deaminating enzyme
MKKKNIDAPVLLAGGGLVGLSAAMFLAQHGVAALVIERLRGVSALPRAAHFHLRTLEMFRSAGIEDEVRAQSEKEFMPEGAIVALESLAGKQIAAFIQKLNEGVEDLSRAAVCSSRSLASSRSCAREPSAPAPVWLTASRSSASTRTTTASPSSLVISTVAANAGLSADICSAPMAPTAECANS